LKKISEDLLNSSANNKEYRSEELFSSAILSKQLPSEPLMIEPGTMIIYTITIS